MFVVVPVIVMVGVTAGIMVVVAPVARVVPAAVPAAVTTDESRARVAIVAPPAVIVAAGTLVVGFLVGGIAGRKHGGRGEREEEDERIFHDREVVGNLSRNPAGAIHIFFRLRCAAFAGVPPPGQPQRIAVVETSRYLLESYGPNPTPPEIRTP